MNLTNFRVSILFTDYTRGLRCIGMEAVTRDAYEPLSESDDVQSRMI